MGAANDGLRFILELCALAALGYWGFHGHEGAARWALGLGAPLAAAVAWVTAINPNGALTPGDPWRLLLEVAVFGAAAAALAATGRGTLAIALAAVVAAHLALTFPLDQR